MNGPEKKPFNMRAFLALLAALSGAALPITGIVDHLMSHHTMTAQRHPWMATHFLLGVIFAIAAAWHAVLNRRVLLKHVRGLAETMPSLSREAIWAVVIVAAAAAIAVGHPYLGK